MRTIIFVFKVYYGKCRIAVAEEGNTTGEEQEDIREEEGSNGQNAYSDGRGVLGIAKELFGKDTVVKIIKPVEYEGCRCRIYIRGEVRGSSRERLNNIECVEAYIHRNRYIEQIIIVEGEEQRIATVREAGEISFWPTHRVVESRYRRGRDRVLLGPQIEQVVFIYRGCIELSKKGLRKTQRRIASLRGQLDKEINK